MPRLPPDKSWRTSTLWRSCTVGSLRPLLPGIHSTSFTKSTCSGSRRRACLLDPSAEEPMLSPPHRGRREDSVSHDVPGGQPAATTRIGKSDFPHGHVVGLSVMGIEEPAA